MRNSRLWFILAALAVVLMLSGVTAGTRDAGGFASGAVLLPAMVGMVLLAALRWWRAAAAQRGGLEPLRRGPARQARR